MYYTRWIFSLLCATTGATLHLPIRGTVPSYYFFGITGVQFSGLLLTPVHRQVGLCLTQLRTQSLVYPLKCWSKCRTWAPLISVVADSFFYLSILGTKKGLLLFQLCTIIHHLTMSLVACHVSEVVSYASIF